MPSRLVEAGIASVESPRLLAIVSRSSEVRSWHQVMPGTEDTVALAAFHTTFNIAGVILYLPFAKMVIRRLENHFVSPDEAISRPQFLDTTLAEVPALALRGLVLETHRMLAEATGNEDAAFAIDHFIYWAARNAGSLAAALGGVDALAFTGGIGENAHDIRARITDALAWLAPKKTMVIPAEEEGFIARQTAALVLEPTP